MEPIFDKSGRTIAWLKDDVIYSRVNRYQAFVHNGSIFTYNAKYLGKLERGFIRDRIGNAVAFMNGASGGPITPITQIPPIPSIPPIPPIHPIPPIPPIAPINSLNWSRFTWDEFIQG